MAQTAVAARNKNDLALQQSNVFADYAGMGMEHVGVKDVTIPRFKILQDLSPEVNRRKDTYIEGAEPGLICNTGFKTIHKAVEVIPCIYRRHHIEWLPDRGGFVADHGEDDSLLRQAKIDDKRNARLPNGNLIVETPTWYVLDIATGTQAIIPMSRTLAASSRDWMTLATAEKLPRPDGHGKYTPPLFYRGYTLTTRMREKGENSWFVWQAAKGPTILELAEATGEDLLSQAIRFAELVKAGEVKVAAESFEDETSYNNREDDDRPI
jgi:hypothetical protein